MPEITACASYQSSRPVLETTVGGVLREAAERAAGTLALVEGTPDPSRRRRWSYADLLAAAENVARALLGRFAPGERVAVWAPNSPEWLLAEFGAALAGLTLVTVNPALRAGEVAHVLGQSRAHGVVVAPAYRGSDLPGVLAQVRGQLPGLREVISLTGCNSFVRSGSPMERLPDVRPDDDAQIQARSPNTNHTPCGMSALCSGQSAEGGDRSGWRPAADGAGGHLGLHLRQDVPRPVDVMPISA